MTNLTDLTIHEAHKLLKGREISSVELTNAFLNNIESLENKIQAFITVTPDLARSAAIKADKKYQDNSASTLTGIPMQIKDIISSKGIPTTCGSNMLKDYIPTYDATVLSRLYENGAILLGKGNMDEFAMGSSTENSFFHPTANPWNLNRVPGGSSGGGAAAVASGESIFALGSDTGGSIRQPAALCGITGLKPTYGLVSRYGLVAFASSLDQIGPMTKDVEDCAIVLNAIHGKDINDSTSLNVQNFDYTESLSENIKGIKIGLPIEYFADGIQAEVRESVMKAADLFREAGAIVEECSLPLTKYALAVYYIIAPSEASSNLARYDGVRYGATSANPKNAWESIESTRGLGFGKEVKRRIMLGTYALSSGYYDAYYVKALKVRSLLRKEFTNAFKQFDAIITPTSPTVAFPIGTKTHDPVSMYMNDACTLAASIAGIPALSIPCGFHEGLPIGMQIITTYLQESTALKLGYAYQKMTDWHKQRPTI
jgi:aspartyl-tRNA(Asn)/glutamyl-tRNA(Gln) amidotransferase subunit A